VAANLSRVAADRRDKLPGPGACTRLERMLGLLTLLAGAALADAPPPSGSSDAATESVSSGDRRTGPFSRDTYPSEAIARPLTLPAGMIRAGAALDVDYIRLVTYDWSTGLGLIGSYGLTDRIELSASAAFGLAPLLAARRMAVSGALLLYDGTSFDLAVAVGLDAAPSTFAPTPAVSLSFPGRLLLADQLFLAFGAQLLRVQVAPLLLPQAALRLGLGVQLASSVAVALDTDVLRFLSSAASGRFLLPLDLSLTAAVTRTFDLRAHVQVYNLANPRLAGTFTLGGSAYF
jgi:hypothetical protein